MSDEQADRRRMLRMVMFAVLIWGTVLAVGAALYGFDATSGLVHFSPNIYRGLIVETCVLGFLGIWLLALRSQR